MVGPQAGTEERVQDDMHTWGARSGCLKHHCIRGQVVVLCNQLSGGKHPRMGKREEAWMSVGVRGVCMCVRVCVCVCVHLWMVRLATSDAVLAPSPPPSSPPSTTE